MTPPPTTPAASADPDDTLTTLRAVVDDLVRARADLAAAVEEAEAAATELHHRTTEVDELTDVVDAGFALVDQVAIVVSTGTRRVRAWSAGAARLFGMGPEEAVGRALGALRVAGLPSARLADEAARLGRPAPAGVTVRSAVVESATGRFELTPAPAGSPTPVAVVVRLVPDPRGSVAQAGSEPVCDAGQPA